MEDRYWYVVHSQPVSFQRFSVVLGSIEVDQRLDALSRQISDVSVLFRIAHGGKLTLYKPSEVLRSRHLRRLAFNGAPFAATAGVFIHRTCYACAIRKSTYSRARAAGYKLNRVIYRLYSLGSYAMTGLERFLHVTRGC